MRTRITVIAAALMLLSPAIANAQDQGWVADISIGYAGFVDDATINSALVGGSVRRHITPRISIGPEMAIMFRSGGVGDRAVMLTSNMVFDAHAGAGTSPRVIPFLVGGVGMFWGRDQVRGGPFWSSDPAFTAGGGLRARVSDSVSAAVEYRLGWELHHRLSASVGYQW